MKTLLPLCALFALTFALVGCNTSTEVSETTDNVPTTDATTVTFTSYCGDCGHGITGDFADHTCDTEHGKCENCPFHKGSELCCKDVKETAGKFFCAKCGHEAGTETCCKEGAETCENCPFHKGSELCCKLEKADDSSDDAPAEDADNGA